jgi:hypothetical protein
LKKSVLFARNPMFFQHRFFLHKKKRSFVFFRYTIHAVILENRQKSVLFARNPMFFNIGKNVKERFFRKSEKIVMQPIGFLKNEICCIMLITGFFKKGGGKLF